MNMYINTKRTTKQNAPIPKSVNKGVQKLQEHQEAQPQLQKTNPITETPHSKYDNIKTLKSAV